EVSATGHVTIETPRRRLGWIVAVVVVLAAAAAAIAIGLSGPSVSTPKHVDPGAQDGSATP
ncbi:MAG: hypothetical protein KC464_17750, partial [Myxococcales bacterium]|nr:hypothetical protein [Myxococcales bacterium]